jgi:general secretion pathway protein A
MDYFSILNLNREPFSNSPDPDYFYHSRQHLDCLQKIELSLHLRRGLNVIIGEVGTGKTTLCRQLIRRFAQHKEMETHLILDPLFKDGADFLSTVTLLLSGKRPAEGTTDWQVKEFIKHSLFRKGVDQKKTTVLIIDEGQKIPVFCLELLREFLNYETNEYKLLQIVIFAQTEFESIIHEHPNFTDRINLYHHLRPLSLRDTHMMIRFRLEKSSSTPQNLNLFTLPALIAIHRVTGGFPRKVINLCHQCILAMIIQNRKKVGWRLVRRCSDRVFRAEQRHGFRWAAAAVAVATGAAVLLWWGPANISMPVALKRPAIVEIPREPVAPAPRALPEPAEALAAIPVALPLPETIVTTAAPVTFATAPLPAPEPVTPPAPVAEPVAVAAPAPVAPKPAEAPPAKAATEVTSPRPLARTGPPESLGSVTLKRNETISGLIHKVYGDYSTRHFRSIILANPQIEDPDRVGAGQVIRLPALPVSAKSLNKAAWWVTIVDTASLQEAFDMLRSYPESAPPVRLIPFWRPSGGTRFAVVLKQIFTNPETAQLQLNLLPPEYQPAGRLVSSWGEGTVLYADPYYRAKQ